VQHHNSTFYHNCNTSVVSYVVYETDDQLLTSCNQWLVVNKFEFHNLVSSQASLGQSSVQVILPKTCQSNISMHHCPLWVRSAIRSRHSPERSILSCISCLQHAVWDIHATCPPDLHHSYVLVHYMWSTLPKPFQPVSELSQFRNWFCTHRELLSCLD